MNNILYVTYQLNGQLKRGVLSSSQYEMYSKNPAVSNLTIHPTQGTMENSFNEASGRKGNTKVLLFG